MEVSGPRRSHRPAHIDPRIRARRIAVQRGVGRRRLQRLVDVGLVAGRGRRASSLALRTPLLDVDAIEVAGNERTAAEAVVAASGIAAGRPAHRPRPAGGRARRSPHLPWVQRGRAAPGDRRRRRGRGHRADARRRGRRGRRRPARGRRGPGPRARVRRPQPRRDARRHRRGGRGPRARASSSATGPPMPWRWPRASAARSTLGLRLAVEDGRLAGVVDPGISVAFGDASQLEAKVRSLAHRARAGRSHLRGHDRPPYRPGARC